MEPMEMLKYVDHTQLKPFATWADCEKLCDEAIQYQTASVCIPPSFVKRIKEAYGDKLNIGTVVGFPFGYSCTAAKIAEVKQALADGASEIDMVINIGDCKEHNYDKIETEIKALKEATGDKILKVIIETCYLTDEEKITMCQVVTNAGADYIKTSTGLGTGGATVEDIKLFKEHVGPKVKMKAAGGVKTIEDLATFIEAGVSRIGASSAIEIAKGVTPTAKY